MDQPSGPDPRWAGRRAAFGTMHGKAEAVGPLLAAALGLRVEAAAGLDTDRLGTFTGEVPRAGTQLEAARAKALAAMDATGADLGLGSEGSFGPHPAIPFVAADRELLVLVDRRLGLEVVGTALTAATNHGFAVAASVADARAFGRRAGFPQHGLVVRDGPDPLRARVVAKGLTDPAAFGAAVEDALAAAGGRGVIVEADMRAHLNPRRMAAIADAARDLIRLMRSACPACAAPGFDAVAAEPGLPCGWCARPTREAVAHVWGCRGCGHEERRPAPGGLRAADPGRCDACNP